MLSHKLHQIAGAKKYVINSIYVHPGNIMKLAYFSIVLSIFSIQAFACTDFVITAIDNTIINARTMEFATDLKSNIRTSTRGRVFKTMIDDKPALEWTAKYGYVYLDGMNVDMSSDGMNEKGLSFGALYLPGIAKYQAINNQPDAKNLPYLHIGDWALSNFATVAELREAIQKINVVNTSVKVLGDMILPLHFSFHDAQGKSLVIEYVAGELHMHDNDVGVLTNDPTYDWHVTNLNNYVNLKPTNPKPIVIKNMTFVATGQGGGMLGLPGDISPPSRFVKMAVFKAVVQPANNSLIAVNLAEHMINNVDIPFGIAREQSTGNYTSEYTQWTVFKDLTNKKFYYKTYYNPALRLVDLNQLDFSEKGHMLKMPISTTAEYIDDVTAKFKQS